MFNTIPWKFILFQDLLPFADLITDFISGFNYYVAGHPHWAFCIWTLMWLPLVLSTSSESLNLFRSCKDKRSRQTSHEMELKSLRLHDVEPRKELPSQTWFQQHEMKILKILAQIPFLQPVVHGVFTHRLYKAERGMKKALADYKEDVIESKNIKEEELMKIKNKVVAAAQEYVRFKNERSSILTTFQGIRLFELVGESGPQAILQVSIALRIGYTDWVQVSIIIIKLLLAQK